MKIASNGIHIHVEDSGAGNLPLVFLHYWGQSDAPASGYTLADLAADAQGVIDALDLQRYLLVGHSMGGKVAQLLASRRSRGLAGFILVAPSPPSPMRLPLEARQGMVAAYASRESINANLPARCTCDPAAQLRLGQGEGTYNVALRHKPSVGSTAI